MSLPRSWHLRPNPDHPTLLEALGAVMGLVGALLMANQYLKILRGLDVAAVSLSSWPATR